MNLVLPQSTVALLPEPALVVGPDGRVDSASPLAADLFGIDPTGSAFTELVPEPARFWRAVGGAPAGSLVSHVPLAVRRADRTPVAVDFNVRALGDNRFLCLLHEVERSTDRTLDLAFDAVAAGMALFNTDGKFVRVNSALCGMLGRGADALLGTRDQELTHPDDRQSDLDAAWRILNGEISTWSCLKRYLRPDGDLVWVAANLTFLRDEWERPLCWVGQFQDVTELHRRGSRDPLTDALNRRAFDAELERCAHAGAAVLVFDLDGFKDINDAHGHEAGDELLRHTADAIRGRLRRDDVLARLGGDEFAVLLPDCEIERAVDIASELGALIAAQRFVFDGIDRSVTASVGVAPVGKPSAALSAADRAMYDAKAVGGNRVRRAQAFQLAG
jgi:diguanylate cyclase (GGDEF)-like protein/PAS domain S-box-containing protein